MLLITYEDVVAMDDLITEKRNLIPMYGHILTHMNLPAVIAYLNKQTAEVCEKFQSVRMGGWFTIIQATDVGVLPLKEIHGMYSRHFSGYYLSNNLERYGFDQVTQEMLNRPNSWMMDRD